MVVEGILLIVILALVGVILFKDYRYSQERLEWTQAMIAKNEREYTAIRSVEKAPTEEKLPTLPDLTPVEEMDMKEFMKAISKNAELTNAE